jgi:hypothetical protein
MAITDLHTFIRSKYKLFVIKYLLAQLKDFKSFQEAVTLTRESILKSMSSRSAKLKSDAQTPKDLALFVKQELSRRKTRAPGLSLLRHLFETLYFASLKEEEAEPVVCTVIYADPHSSDHPESSSGSWFTYVRFAERIPFDVSNLVKLAAAVDPLVSSLAVYKGKGNELFIWGLIDQVAFHAGRYTAWEAHLRPQIPGDFQARILGTGSISVFKGYAPIGSLQQNILVRDYTQALWAGPVHHRLVEYFFTRHFARVLPDLAKFSASLGLRTLPVPNSNAEFIPVVDALMHMWIGSISRILLNIQRYRHGGAILLLPKESLDGLNVKYKIEYQGLAHALIRHSVGFMVHRHCEEQLCAVLQQHATGNDETIQVPQRLLLADRVSKHHTDMSLAELAGCVGFIGALSKVDGLVLMDGDCVVHGFGVTITVEDEVDQIWMCRDNIGTPALLQRRNSTHYGTRHRSMMRFCARYPGSVGFVVSQDGYIRAITKSKDKLLMWENVTVEASHEEDRVIPLDWSKQRKTSRKQSRRRKTGT